MKLLKNIFSVHSAGVHKVVCIFGLKIKIRDLKKEVYMLKREFNNKIEDVERLNLLRIKKIIPVKEIKTIEVHIVDHCNLNCKGCHHFAPLASESYLSLTEFRNDLERLHQLTKGEVSTFNILGGEPLLHPQCLEFLETARNIFPKSQINLITNGILLPSQPNNFYEKCASNNIYICPTKYNLDINWQLIKEKCEQFGVSFKFYQENKLLYKDITDIKASQDKMVSFFNCQLGWHEIFYLDHGKLYHCAKEAYIRFFSEYFKKDIKIPESDYIDIYKADNIQQVYDFMSSIPQFCSHCVRNKELSTYKWEISKKDINEWT